MLDARKGKWQDRKRWWISKGIKSEVGRDKVQSSLDSARQVQISGDHESESWVTSSIFDPTLCELVYRWFCPDGGSILDPFAGGSVRGIVAAILGYEYVGVDLSSRQVAANQTQACEIIPGYDWPLDAVTPIEKYGDVWVKRDDKFRVAGVNGGKVRTCLALSSDAVGLVTAGSRSSPQVNIVAHIAKHLGVPCRVHVPSGELTPELLSARGADAEIIQETPGYNNVIISRAKKDADESGWTNIPFGMECSEAIEQVRRQVVNIPDGIQRIVVPVGSAMSLAGILWGLKDSGLEIPVVGVTVGADPTNRLDEYAPPDWRNIVTLVDSGTDYSVPATTTTWHGIQLDPYYEAKCIPFVEDGDLFWIVGVRETVLPKVKSTPSPTWIVGDSREIPILVSGDFDFVFSCPPYADLEVYSDDPSDLSTLTYDEFIEAYRDIISKSVAKLKPNRFACFVVGDIRDKQGFYRNFVSDTIAAFQDAGAMLYNEAILITAVGSLPVRINRQFQGYRKLGKTHQNILIFYKGDVKRIPEIYSRDIVVDEYYQSSLFGDAGFS